MNLDKCTYGGSRAAFEVCVILNHLDNKKLRGKLGRLYTTYTESIIHIQCIKNQKTYNNCLNLLKLFYINTLNDLEFSYYYEKYGNGWCMGNVEKIDKNLFTHFECIIKTEYKNNLRREFKNGRKNL